MILIRQIKIPVLENQEDGLKKKIARKLMIREEEILSYEIIKKSIDARDKKNLLFVYEIRVCVKEEEKILKRVSSFDVLKDEEVSYVFPKNEKKMEDRPIIVGSGPAGLFCAYMLASSGYQPIIFERGDKMEDRIQTVAEFFQTNQLDPESNIQFGEGGAGTFSDGKLHTLTKDKMGRNRKVFEIFVENGAPKEILYLQNPHIGTDILRDVIRNMREKILKWGGEFHYRSRVSDLLIENGCVVGVMVNEKDAYYSRHVVFAIGHSARDTFRLLSLRGIMMQPKSFAVGVRVEHPRKMINESQYGEFSKALESASYKLTYQTRAGRAVCVQVDLL